MQETRKNLTASPENLDLERQKLLAEKAALELRLQSLQTGPENPKNIEVSGGSDLSRKTSLTPGQMIAATENGGVANILASGPEQLPADSTTVQNRIDFINRILAGETQIPNVNGTVAFELAESLGLKQNSVN